MTDGRHELIQPGDPVGNGLVAADPNDSVPIAVPAIVPTQTVFPGRAVLRTIVAVLIAALAVINGLIPIIQSLALDAAFTTREAAYLNGCVVVLTLIAGIITRVMAIPIVNEGLARLGLSASK